MKNKKINMYPKNPVYMFAVILMITFMLLFLILPFVLLINDKPMKIFDIIPLNNGLIQFIVLLPISTAMILLFLRRILFKITFTDKMIIAPKVYQIQNKKIEIDCSQILTCTVKFQTLYFYFVYECTDGKTREMFITHFSKKQIKIILKMIKARGGLSEQSIDELIVSINSKSKKKEK